MLQLLLIILYIQQATCDLCSGVLVGTTSNYQVEWRVAGSVMSFSVSADTNRAQWIGLGFSSTPSMVS